MVTLGTLFIGAHSSTAVSPVHFSHFSHLPRTRWEPFASLFPIPRLGGSQHMENEVWVTQPVTWQQGTSTTPLLGFVSLHCSKGTLETWHLPPSPGPIVRISWVLFQSSLSCLQRHLLTFMELLQAHPATPTRAKYLLRRRKAAPTAHLCYDMIQTQPVLSVRPVS